MWRALARSRVALKRAAGVPLPRRGFSSDGSRGSAATKHHATHGDAGSQRVTVADMAQFYQRIEDSLRFRGYSTLPFVIAGLAATGTYLYFRRDQFKKDITEGVADVASRSLEDVTVVTKANELSKNIVNTLLSDAAVREVATVFITDLLASESIRATAIKSLSQILADPSMQQYANQLAFNVVQQILQDPKTLELVLHLLVNLLAQPTTQTAVVSLLQEVFKLQPTLDYTTQFAQSVVASEPVTKQALELAMTISQSVINDPSIKDNLTNLFKETLADQTLHAQGGQAIWQAVKYSVTPKFMLETPKQQQQSQQQQPQQTSRQQPVQEKQLRQNELLEPSQAPKAATTNPEDAVKISHETALTKDTVPLANEANATETILLAASTAVDQQATHQDKQPEAVGSASDAPAPTKEDNGQTAAVTVSVHEASEPQVAEQLTSPPTQSSEAPTVVGSDARLSAHTENIKVMDVDKRPHTPLKPTSTTATETAADQNANHGLNDNERLAKRLRELKQRDLA